MTGADGFPTRVKGKGEHMMYSQLEKEYREDWDKWDNVDFSSARVLIIFL